MASRVPLGVLEPVRRRRRRRGRGPLVAATLVVTVAAAGLAWALIPRGASSSPAAAAARRANPAPRPAVTPRRSQAPARGFALTAPALSRRPFRPPITARAAIVIDLGSGRVLWALRPHRRLPIASTTKIMTALVALRAIGLRTFVTVVPAATRVPLVKEGLRPRERVRAWKLFDGLLLFSGNDDALALAVAAAGSRTGFVARMNDTAAELGLADTHFSSPSGVIDENNYSSAWDLAVLTRAAFRDSRFRRIVRQRIAHVPWSPPTFEKVYVNKNSLIGSYPGADGVKTGWTTLAGHCLVASATRRGRTIVAVVLDDGNVDRDARRLLDRGFSVARQGGRNG